MERDYAITFEPERMITIVTLPPLRSLECVTEVRREPKCRSTLQTGHGFICGSGCRVVQQTGSGNGFLRTFARPCNVVLGALERHL